MSQSRFDPAQPRRAVNVAWLIGYAVIMAVVVWGVLLARDATIRDLSTPQARAEWQAWREAAPNLPNAAPVRRQAPTTEDPAALVLMRDRFAAVMAAAVVFTTLFYVVMMVALRGAFAPQACGTDGPP
jgi:hypothetical protein